MYFKYRNTCTPHKNENKIAEIKSIPYFSPVVYILIGKLNINHHNHYQEQIILHNGLLTEKDDSHLHHSGWPMGHHIHNVWNMKKYTMNADMKIDMFDSNEENQLGTKQKYWLFYLFTNVYQKKTSTLLGWEIIDIIRQNCVIKRYILKLIVCHIDPLASMVL